jgi:large subunit ribosomal protein L32
MLPVARTSKARKNKRRSHHALRRPNLVGCPKCGLAKLPHTACDNCGYVSSSVALVTKDQES